MSQTDGGSSLWVVGMKSGQLRLERLTTAESSAERVGRVEVRPGGNESEAGHGAAARAAAVCGS